MCLRIFLLFLALNMVMFVPSGHAQPAPPPVMEWLKQAGIPLDAAGIVVATADGGKTLLSHNAQQAFNPASVMKLYTTYGALELLGAPHTWKTQLVSTAKQQNGTLTGDVFIKGSGDPSLKLQDVWRLLRELRLAGVKHIAGDWVLDRSVFADGKTDTCDFDGECARPYNVAPDGLLMSFNATRIAFKPTDKPNEAGWNAFADPLPLGWTIQGNITATAGGCGDWRNKLMLSFKPYTNANGGVIQVGGSIPKSCAPQEVYRTIAPAQGYASGLVKTLWAELGGTHAGGFKAGAAPSDTVVLAELESDPLSTIVRDINKRSNNVMARMLFLNLARIPQANKAAADTRLRVWLSSAGLNDASLNFDNGSGLSREERASAAAITKLLQYAFAGPLMPEFMSSLAVMAQDGTVARRISPAAGTAHVKTGTLKDSAALAGYVLGASGKRYAFAAIVNHGNVGGARTVFDKLVLWLQQQG